MVLAYGPPTLFLTLSCAEYDWDDVRKVLIDRLVLSGVPKEKWEKLSTMELIELDPVGFSQHFRRRFETMWDIILG